MLTVIATQSLAMPFLLSALVQFGAGFSHIVRQNTGPVLLLGWAMIFIWISGVPQMLPRQASDWMWLLLLAGLGVELFIAHRKWRARALQVLMALTVPAILWPVLSYEFSFASHSGVLVEVAVFLAAALYCLRPVSANGDPVGYLATAFFTGLTGALTMASGSMMLGLLAVSLATVHTLPALRSLFTHTLPASLFTLLALLLLLMARHYAELPLAATLALLAGHLLCRESHMRWPVRSALLVVFALLASVWVAWLELTVKQSVYY